MAFLKLPIKSAVHVSEILRAVFVRVGGCLTGEV